MHLRIIAFVLACAALMGAGTQSAFALPNSAATAGAVASAQAAVPVSLTSVSADQTSRAAQLLGVSVPPQVAFIPVCYYVYRYAYICGGGRCYYVWRYVYVCN